MHSKTSKALARQRFKKLKFLLSLTHEKSENWILENLSEKDFLELFEALVWLAEEAGQLEKIDKLLPPSLWKQELNSVSSYNDFLDTDVATEYAEEFNQEN